MDKRKFLFVSLSGLIGDIAWQVLKEGHDVRYYIDNEKGRDIADGFVPKSKDWEKDAKWADIVVFDDTLGQGARTQALRKEGKPVIGGSEYTDRLEEPGLQLVRPPLRISCAKALTSCCPSPSGQRTGPRLCLSDLPD
jgi:phosphoribosylamine---glycine ligase